MKIAFRHIPFSASQKEQLDTLARNGGYETIWYENHMTPSAEELVDCVALMGYFAPDLIAQLPALKWVQTPAAGVERLCANIYQSDNVVLTNCSGAFGIAISEYMLMGMLMLMRNAPAYMENQHAHVWKCMGQCRSVYGSVITVVGMGDIGSHFAKRVKALGATVRGVRRSTQAIPQNFDEVYTPQQLTQAVQGADVVAMCLPGTKQTTGMISADVIAAMDKNAIVINCGRGYTMDQEALTSALEAKQIGGAVLDVTSVEPLPADDLLWDMDNVIITPHISGHDDDPVNAQCIFDIFVENLTHFLAGEPMTHVVDRQSGY